MPIFSACAGKSEVSVMPGLVLISNIYGMLLCTKKSTLETPQHPQAKCALIASSLTSFVKLSEKSAGKINSVKPFVYFAS